MHVHARAHGLRAKQTHTSQSRFLLQLFVSPWHFEACSCLPVSLPLSSLPPPQRPLPPFCSISCVPNLPSTTLSICLNPRSTESLIKYFIMSQRTK